MAFNRLSYSPEDFQQIYDLLLSKKKKGIAFTYDIAIGEIPVVERTDNLKLFKPVLGRIREDSKSITIRIYSGKSNNNDKYQLVFKHVAGQELAGFDDFESKITKELDRRQAELDLDRFRVQNAELLKANKALTADNDRLESELNGMQVKHALLGSFGAIAGPFLEGALNNSKLSESPLGGLLGNMLGSGGTKHQPAELPSGSGSTSFSAEETPLSNAGLSPEYAELCRNLEAMFTPQERGLILSILGHMADDKSKILTIYQLVDSRNNG
ncbi:MAG: hypothetical protein V4543_00710 [Bacteroidota bacterium]